MPKGIPHSGAFKREVIEHMRNEGLSFRETARLYGLNDHKMVMKWERIYLEEGAEGLNAERRGGGSTGRPPKLDEQMEQDLIAENQRLRAEVAYLKNLQALVLEDERRLRKKRR